MFMQRKKKRLRILYKKNVEQNRKRIDKENYIKFNKQKQNIKLMKLGRRYINKNYILRKIRLKSQYVLATPEIRKARNTFRVQGNGAEGKAKTETQRHFSRLPWLQVFLLQLAKYNEKKKTTCK